MPKQDWAVHTGVRVPAKVLARLERVLAIKGIGRGEYLRAAILEAIERDEDREARIRDASRN